MKLSLIPTKARRGQLAFTLTEMMVAAATLVIVLGSVISINLYGISMAARQQAWLGASDGSAKAIGTLMENIRGASSLAVGSYVGGIFAPVANNAAQAGNALMITNVSSTQTVLMLYYYCTLSNADGQNNCLVQSNYYGPTNAANFSLVSATDITNDASQPMFTEVDYTGAPLASATPLASVRVLISFNAAQNPQVVLESGSLVNLYQMQAIVTPRIRL